jgi:type IV pilus assembly protein PilB
MNNQNLHKLIPAEYALRNIVVPIGEMNGFVKIAFSDQADLGLINELELILNRNVSPVVWKKEKILQEIKKNYGIGRFQKILDQSSPQNTNDSEIEQFQLKETGQKSDRTIINLVNQIINRAIIENASDVHIECYEKLFRIRFRIDGKLVDSSTATSPNKSAIISRFKIMAKLDIAEKRRPQDGRIRLQKVNGGIDIRVSTLPTDFGEKIVLRILDKSTVKLDLDKLGFRSGFLDEFKRILKSPYGMVLVTGPTGSGKTTTVYSSLNYLNCEEVNIISIEDPIEYYLRGINQTEVKQDIGLTFPGLLRNILRQDPDIIMIGEMRDLETMNIAVRAALTGHLVLSTLHTNNAAGSILRLLDMGVKPFLIGHALKMVVSQRLIRKICSFCKIVDKESEKSWKQYQMPVLLPEQHLYKGKGCSHCYYTGFSGREAILEYLTINEEIVELISNDPSMKNLRNYISKMRYPTLQEQFYEKIMQGITSFSEIFSESAP